MIDLIGKKFNRWTVLSRIDSTDNRHKWLCRCECGREKIVCGRYLLCGRSKSCGCYKHDKEWRGYGEISGSYWSAIKHTCKTKNRELSIDIKYIWDLFLKQNRKCALTGRLIFFAQDYRYKKYIQTASLDRIDSDKGYIQGNVCWLHKNINMFKRTMHNNDFIRFCREIVEYQDKQEGKWL